jgi:uncharacterized protein (AIM24 family)/Tfp pilus assembly protein PilF
MADESQTPFDQGLYLVHLNRGREHFEQRNFADAIQELDQARRLRPTDETVLNLLGLAYFKQEKYREADKVYNQLIDFNPGSDILYFNQGLVCFKLGALDRAEAAFLRALEIVTENPKVNFYLGHIYERKKQYYNAIFQYRKAGANIMVQRVQEKIEAVRTASKKPDTQEITVERETPSSPREKARVEAKSATDTSPAPHELTVDTIDRRRFLTALQQPPLEDEEPSARDKTPAGGGKTKPIRVLDKEIKTPTDPEVIPTEPMKRPADLPGRTGADGPTTDALSRPLEEQLESADEPATEPVSESATDSGPEPSESVKEGRTVVELTEPVIPDLSLSELSHAKQPTGAQDALFAASAKPPPARRRRGSDSRDIFAFGPPGERETGRSETVPVRRRISFDDEDERREATQLYGRMRRRDDIFRYLENNLMEVNFSGKVFIKQGTIYSYSGNLTFWVKPQREGAATPLVIVSGTGRLLLSDHQREITVMQINGEEVFIEPSHLLACQETLMPRYALIKKEGTSEPKIQVLAIQGTGMIALSVATDPLLLTVTDGFPVNVSSANIISWSGDLTPSIVDDEALADLMYPHEGPPAVNLRLEGSGKVMMEKLIG